MLIFHCRIRLFLAIIQQRTLLGGTPTLRLQVQPVNYTLIPHHDSAENLYMSKKKLSRNYNSKNLLE